MELWLPIGFEVGKNIAYIKPLYDFANLQIIQNNNYRAILFKKSILDKWKADSLLENVNYEYIKYGNNTIYFITSSVDYFLQPIHEKEFFPSNINDINSFIIALNNTRNIVKKDISLAESIFLEKYSILLPTYTSLNSMDDNILIGSWITGGVQISTSSVRRISQLTGFSQNELSKVLSKNEKLEKQENKQQDTDNKNTGNKKKLDEFKLSGRPELEEFFNEYVIDIVNNRDNYKALGIEFPSATILYGPPGCGKTYAVEQLVNFLDWPSYRIESSSVASPYIHETSKKVAEVFETAMENSPSVLIIDEMEAFLSDRNNASSSHNIEEMAEFLRKIPEAIQNNVLIIAMTNKIDMIDPAILRRGRFDHKIEVDHASEKEIEAMMLSSLEKISKEDNLDIKSFAKKLQGKPLSDVAFFLKEGARIAVKNGKTKLDNESFNMALNATINKKQEDTTSRMGFI